MKEYLLKINDIASKCLSVDEYAYFLSLFVKINNFIKKNNTNTIDSESTTNLKHNYKTYINIEIKTIKMDKNDIETEIFSYDKLPQYILYTETGESVSKNINTIKDKILQVLQT